MITFKSILSEELVGNTFVPSRNNRDNGIFSIYKNPKSIEAFPHGIKAISDKNGNLYVCDTNIAFHDDIYEYVKKKLGSVFDRINRSFYNDVNSGETTTLTWERFYNSNVFYLGESVAWVYDSNIGEDKRAYLARNFTPTLEKIRKINPQFKFVFSSIDVPSMKPLIESKEILSEILVGSKMYKPKYSDGVERIELYKNPPHIDTMGERMMSDEDGNLYCFKSNKNTNTDNTQSNVIHVDLVKLVNDISGKKIFPEIGSKWERNPSMLPWQSFGGKLYIGESNYDWMRSTDKTELTDMYKEHIKRLKSKNPNLEFVYTNILDKNNEKVFLKEEKIISFKDLLSEIKIGSKMFIPKWGKKKEYIELYKNPESINTMNVRMISDVDGNLYAFKSDTSSSEMIHGDLAMLINDISGRDVVPYANDGFYNIARNNIRLMAWERIKSELYLGESSGWMERKSSDELRSMYGEQIKKLRKKNPNIKFNLKYVTDINSPDVFLVEYVIHKNYSLDSWKKLDDDTKDELKNKDKNKDVWRVVHGHKKGMIGKPIDFYKDKYTNLDKANSIHKAIVLNQ